MEAKARKVWRVLLAQGLELLSSQRHHAWEIHAPRFPKRGRVTKLQDRRHKRVEGLEGSTQVERNYYVCPNECGQMSFLLALMLRLRPDS